MLETAVGDGAKKLRFQQEVAETGRVNADIAALAGVAIWLLDVSLLLLSIGVSASRNCLGGLDLLVRIINQILLGGHFVVVVRVVNGRIGVVACLSGSARVRLNAL